MSNDAQSYGPEDVANHLNPARARPKPPVMPGPDYNDNPFKTTKTETISVVLDLADLRGFGTPDVRVDKDKVFINLDLHPAHAAIKPMFHMEFSDRLWIDEAFKTKMREQVLRALILELLA